MSRDKDLHASLIQKLRINLDQQKLDVSKQSEKSLDMNHHGHDSQDINVVVKIKQLLNAVETQKKQKEIQSKLQKEIASQFGVEDSREISKVMAEFDYNSSCKDENQLPLPILKKVQKKILYLDNYHMNTSLAKALQLSIAYLVPYKINRIYLINNGMSDQDYALILSGLKNTKNIKEIGYFQNNFGGHSIYALNELLQNDCLTTLRALTIKDIQNQQPTGQSKDIPQLKFKTLLKNMSLNTKKIFDLEQITLSKMFQLDQSSISSLSLLVPQLDKLRLLDVSYNSLEFSLLNKLIEALSSNNKLQLKYLDISYNFDSKTQQNKDLLTFNHVLSNYLKHNMCLQHLNISGMNLSHDQLIYIFKRGIKRSKTLLSVHTACNNISQETLKQLRLILRVKKFMKEGHQLDKQLEDYHVKLQQKADQISQTEYNLERIKLRRKQVIEEHIRRPLVEENQSDRFAFIRYLGNQEIQDGMISFNCLQTEKQHLEFDESYYKDNKQVYIKIQGQDVEPMMKLEEFIYRLNNNTGRYTRNTQRDIEDSRIKEFVNQFNQRDHFYQSKLLSTYNLQNLNRQQSVANSTGSPSPFDSQASFSNFQKQTKRLPGSRYKQKPWNIIIYQGAIKKNSAQGMIDIEKYFGLSSVYDQVYVYSCYLPPRKLNVILKQRDNDQKIDYLNLYLQKREIDIPLGYKCVKKIVEKREFIKEKSVFRDCQVDNQNLYKKCFEYDMKFSKIRRFVKDTQDFQDLCQTLLNNYGIIKNQFINAISSSGYPQVSWMDFAKVCDTVIIIFTLYMQWEVVDKNLPMSTVDRLFIAVNVEIIDLEENLDRSLCRYEFFEILVRMAFSKYVEKGPLRTINEGLIKLIQDHLVENAVEKIDSEGWRLEELWSLEVDDLLKANMNGIKQLYKYMCQGRKQLEYETAIDMIHETTLNMTSEEITTAFAYSKSTFVQEMEDIWKYKRMPFHEFLEFLGRLGQVKYQGEPLPLETKIEMVLEQLFPLVSEKVRQAKQNDDIESETDYEDDLIELSSKILIENQKQKTTKLNNQSDDEEFQSDESISIGQLSHSSGS
ncbi:UNKNOWN [Stylonychia lemnae]|uniref:Leucine rich repeat family protein n=1 Tax=Stylonychia lemnae TaxID=5949 RepID=A0A078AR12_STYLE|nr:UNKNOWN [Stylonychia lemnae]|eukprot:CDW84855.1 UNKNOWN [Stylonychia lemnae]